MSPIIGREKEISLLERLLASKKAEFLAIYGRRRIGKTFLIHQFFKDKGVYFEATGIRGAAKSEQLRRFHQEVLAVFPTEAGKPVPKRWSEAFDLLKDAVSKIDPSTKCILFLDELPWLASSRSGFLPDLDYAWNRHFSRMPNVILVICGSAATWIIQKVLNDKGGLHGRLSAQIRLEPFTLAETEHFLREQDIRLKRKQLIELYMTFGGVAKYLTNINPGKSATQLINEVCFTPQGALFAEFTKLYQSLFDSSDRHVAVVRALARKSRGMKQAALLEAADLPLGGNASDVLRELEESGFILSLLSFGKRSKEKLWRLLDEYSLFYLIWIEPVKEMVLRNFDKEYWNKVHHTAIWYSWAGHAFENICLKHAGNIKAALGLAGVMTSESQWQYLPPKKSDERGAEIDLIIDRADDCINLCEIKFCDGLFEMTADYAADLERKKAVFQKITGTRKSLFITLITPFGAKENSHYIGVVDQQLTLDSLF